MATGLGWYETAIAGGAIAQIVVAVVAARNREKPAMTLLVAMSVSAAIWSIGAFGATVAPAFETARLFKSIAYAGIVTIVLFYALFALEYTGRSDLLTRRLVALLSVEPLVVLALIWSTPFDGLLVEHVSHPISGAVVVGPAFQIHLFYSYILIGVATLLLVRAAVRAERLYQGQFAAIVIAVMTPLMSNLLFNFGPMNHDLSPAAFAVSAVALLFATHRFEFMDIVPAARSTVVDTIEQAMVVVDKENRILDVNPAFRELLDVDDAIGNQAEDVLADYPELRAFDERDDSQLVTVEETDGTTYLKMTVSDIYDERDRLLGRSILLQDVTEQKRQQQELERQNEQLDQFARVITHDLRNPLTVAKSRTEIAYDTGNVEHLEKAMQAHERIEQLITDVREMVKTERQLDETGRVALGHTAEVAWQYVETHDGTLVVDCELVITASKGPFMQLLENLYRNAIQHGGPSVTVRIGQFDDGFYVEDDGPGIPEDEREMVLETGYTDHDDGTGFGLTIVQQVADAHDWEVNITESADGGARFEFHGVDIRGSTETRGASTAARDRPE